MGSVRVGELVLCMIMKVANVTIGPMSNVSSLSSLAYGIRCRCSPSDQCKNYAENKTCVTEGVCFKIIQLADGMEYHTSGCFHQKRKLACNARPRMTGTLTAKQCYAVKKGTSVTWILIQHFLPPQH